ncbi:MAG: hypothetical protein CM15mP14_3940 [Rhodospirillaceae bacterium]|nr:MAG: hypothetical protein CM15mP14_3940 [Rhodospirillaceae bacterium]
MGITAASNRKNNILTQGYVKRGNIEKGFKNSKYIAQGSFTTPFIEHAYIEPEAGYAIRKNNRMKSMDARKHLI